MKKIIFSVIFGCLVLTSNAFAKEELVEPINPDGQGRSLVNTDVATLTSRVNELERRVKDLEREQRFNQEQVRQLDRDVRDNFRRL